MGVRVTTRTLLQLVMGLAAVAHTASWYGICALRRVFGVTVQAAHFGFVFLSPGSYGLGLLRVAHDTQGIGQGRGC